MTKQHFIALADTIIFAAQSGNAFSDVQVAMLADLCQSQNPRFDRQRWLDYIKGVAGPNGGKRHAI